MRRITVILCAVIVSACTPVVRYKAVPVVVTKYQPLPAKWLKPCPKAQPKDNSGLEVLRVASDRGACVDKLNAQMGAIKSVQPASASSS